MVVTLCCLICGRIYGFCVFSISFKLWIVRVCLWFGVVDCVCLAELTTFSLELFWVTWQRKVNEIMMILFIIPSVLMNFVAFV